MDEAEAASTKYKSPLSRLLRASVVLVGVAVVAMVGLASFFIYEVNEASRWRSFVAKHECKVIDREEAVITTLPTRWINGQEVRGSSSTGARELWLCKDNARYWQPAGLADRTGK
jgi:hypothetical protein